MRYSRLFSTITQWCRSFFHIRNTANSLEPMWFLSPSSHGVPQIMACSVCIQTFQQPAFHLVDSVVNNLTYWLCPHVLAEVRMFVRVSPLVRVGHWHPSTSLKLKLDLQRTVRETKR